MINVIKGDILYAKENILIQQVNCQGIMGAGLALEIKQKYKEVESTYKEVCRKHTPNELLGKTLIVKCHDGKIIANIFGQINYGRNKQQTDYDALKQGFETIFYNIKHVDEFKGKTVALPMGIGCGLAGGDWKIVSEFVEELSEKFNITANIYQKN